jgi:hypothetical protein
MTIEMCRWKSFFKAIYVSRKIIVKKKNDLAPLPQTVTNGLWRPQGRDRYPLL